MDLLSRFATVRRAVMAVRRKADLSRYHLESARVHDVDVDQAAQSLRVNGLFRGLRLREQTVREINEYCSTAVCYGDGNRRYGFTYGQKRRFEAQHRLTFSRASYRDVERELPAIHALARDGVLNAIAARHIGAHPMYTDCRLWWIFAADEATFDKTGTAAFFHYDKDDYAALRVLFYLTDVDHEAGPHQLIRGSHTRKALSQVISLGERREADLIEYYGANRIETIVGAAGSGFAEDPFCFHRATRPLRHDRLVLQLRFATKNYLTRRHPKP